MSATVSGKGANAQHALGINAVAILLLQRDAMHPRY